MKILTFTAIAGVPTAYVTITEHACLDLAVVAEAEALHLARAAGLTTIEPRLLDVGTTPSSRQVRHRAAEPTRA